LSNLGMGEIMIRAIKTAKIENMTIIFLFKFRVNAFNFVAALFNDD